MRDFCAKLAGRFPGLPPAPFGEWKGVVARASGPFDPGFAAVSPIIGKFYAELPLRGDRPNEAYLPIEALRDQEVGAVLHDGAKVARTFRSSGTTQETRSLVRFSPAGLECYRQESLYTFFHVLGEVLGTDPWQATGISLVPEVTEWPDSSLAQMVAWIAETVPVRYVTPATFAAAVRATGDKPVWVFGTAFHWVNLLDDARTTAADLRLPAGSVVFETGGTKGKTREVTREGLYAEISQTLGVPDAKIVSEYGMCELTTQAYDYVRPNESGSRRFRFPAWVDARVVTGPGAVERTGTGALLVEDPLRVDAPWALRTEDLATLTGDGFTLHGRIPSAPLKGCSLNVDAVMAREGGGESRQTVRSSGPTAAAREGMTVALDAVTATARAKVVAEAMTGFLQDAVSRRLLAHELGSDAAAASALQDLGASAPATPAAWLAATHVATASSPSPKRWLFVLPDSHSLVGLYPLALGYCAGIEITVRLPARFAAPSLLTHFIELLNRQPDASITTISDSYRIMNADHGFDAILAYGQDETIAALAAVAAVPVQGFGSRFSLGVVDAGEVATEAANIAKDAFSLAQAGCLSSRLLIVTGSENVSETTLARTLADAGVAFWQNAHTPATRLGFDLETWRCARLGYSVHVDERVSAPLIATRRMAASDVSPSFIERSLSPRPFVLPVIMIADSNPQLFVKTALAPIRASGYISCVTIGSGFSLTKSDYVGLSFRMFGQANVPIWDGRHEGRPLFTGVVAR